MQPSKENVLPSLRLRDRGLRSEERLLLLGLFLGFLRVYDCRRRLHLGLLATAPTQFPVQFQSALLPLLVGEPDQLLAERGHEEHAAFGAL